MPDLTRRDFLKYGGVLASAIAVQQVVVRTADATLIDGDSVSRTTGRTRVGIPSTCQLCHARCGIIGFVENGRLVKIEGNPKHPNNRGKICAKGQAGVNLLYDPDRVLYPLRRLGPRGSGQWEQISWDQAYEEVAARMREIRDSGRPEELVFQAGTATTGLFVGRFLDAFGAPNNVNHFSHADYNKLTAQIPTWGAGIEVNDAAHARYMLNFGANPYESHFLHMPLIQRIIASRRENGAKLVTFDVRLSNTAGKSDEWFPLKPGTDGAVALAMADVIMREDLYDRDFLGRWTNVSADELSRHLANYTPEWAEKISGVRAADIRRIAVEFATRKPATTISGSGASMHFNGTQTERSIALLNAITGNIDVKGGYCLPRMYQINEPEPVPPKPKSQSEQDLFARSQALSPTVIERIAGGKQRVALYMTYAHNPAYSNPDTALSRRVLSDEKLVPFLVAVDAYLSESASLADIVLPDTTYLERWDLESNPAFEMIPFLALRQPVIQPRGESVPFHDMCMELAHRIGGGMEKYFMFGKAEDYLAAILKGFPEMTNSGGLQYLKDNGVWYQPDAKPVYGAYKADGFNTPSGKFEIHCDTFGKRGFPALPTYEPVPQHQGIKEDHFILTTYKPGVLTSSLGNSKWLAEIGHDNRILVHPATALTLGVTTGETVKLVSSTGAFEGKIRVTQGIQEKTIAVAGSLGHTAMGEVAQAEKRDSADPDTRLVWWGEHGKGVSPNAAFVTLSDPIGGGQAWNDTVVSIERIA